MSTRAPSPFHPVHLQLAEQLRAELSAQDAALPEGGARVPVSRYTSAERCEEERAMFQRHPIVALHASELVPGTSIATEVAEVGVILARGHDGVVRGFLNACRHRAARLIEPGSPCAPHKAYVCPYHGWSYALEGGLLHRPHAQAFSDAECTGLVPVLVEELAGLIWVTVRPAPSPTPLREFLGPIAGELEALSLASHVAFRRSKTTRAANWKLIIEAFLEAYHIRVLHRRSIYPFFLDARALAERVGAHVRAVTARAGLATLRGPAAHAELRELVTPSYLLFPGTILIAHPDYVSLVSAQPLTASSLRWEHLMLVPAEAARAQGAQQHWENTFSLIEQTVFQREDLHIAESMQAGIATGADDALTFGRMEIACVWLHEAIEAALSH